ncbi:ubiquitin-like domain-containing protein [Candidatus Contubernalis alkaliaceticus]|uniref:ubiquitin-like domain-containing protein n=1 Tax=Candidatus Contubernalis alkaliaceticus TaxID=338645 RepID=UPI001F4BDD2C|nr:ubiquitin-like domain-containing protein [Candidatus Contubernalis alkalaceticus]UNC91106.1 hypothetical protein HUE98_02800 [Candidatus Contubernalis alkalaceticus]
MAKIFVDVITPGNGKTYEFQLDNIMTVGQVKSRMIDEITELESGNITLKLGKTMLCNLDTREQLDEAETLRNAGIKSGHSLLLI